MTSVVIIHAQEDALPARALAEKLRQGGFTPIIEQAGKEDFRQKLREASVAMALWSPRSVTQQELIADAMFAHGIAPVIHARMQNAIVPTPFEGDAAIDLTGWRGEDDFAAWRDLLKTVSARVGLPEPAQPAQRAASPFFQPGPASSRPAAALAEAPRPALAPAPRRPAPARDVADISEERLAPIRPLSEVSRMDYSRAEARAPVEPRSTGGGKLAFIGAATFIVVAAVGLGGYFAWDRYQAGQSAESAWVSLDQTDPLALQAFMHQHHGSGRDGEARRRLAALESSAYQHARGADTIEAFQTYLTAFPEGDHVLAARGRIAELQQMPAPAVALNPNIDPATGQPIDPNAPQPDPDAVPPGIGDLGGPPVDSSANQGGPVQLGPPPSPPAQPTAPATPTTAAPSGAPL